MSKLSHFKPCAKIEWVEPKWTTRIRFYLWKKIFTKHYLRKMDSIKKEYAERIDNEIWKSIKGEE